MAGGSLLALFDDIATILDDVAAMTKIAAKKTAGVLGDDLALNAEQVSGVKAAREIPVVWAVAKGSALNKVILVPAALLISVIAPWLIAILLMIGGAYLCFEGVEKLIHTFLHKKDTQKEKEQLKEAFTDSSIDMVAFEKEKIKGAIRTDFVLSAEIIVITLGTVQNAPLLTKILVLIVIAVVITVGVYGLVAGIVKLDDAGLYLLRNKNESFGGKCSRGLGKALLAICPWLMKTLTIVGTAAMFLVGGGILVHGMPFLHHILEAIPSLGAIADFVIPILMNFIVGIIAGAIVVLLVTIIQMLKPGSKTKAEAH